LLLAVLRVPPVFKVFREQQDLKVQQVLLDLMVHKVPKEYKVSKACKGFKEQLVFKDLDTLSYKELLELRGPRGSKDFRAFKVTKVFRV
jgi:hypothetical protein